MDDNQQLDNFCSRSSNGIVVERVCIYCGYSFTMPYSRRDRLAICSSGCRDELRAEKSREALKAVKFDEEDRAFLEMHLWFVDTVTGYVRAKIDGRNVSMHRFLMGLAHGDRMHVDHINGDRTDNRRGNLRLCTPSQNGANTKLHKANKSGVKGVYWHVDANKWAARIARQWLGLYETKEDAHEAYKKAALDKYGEFANFG